jgi:hypothetical protein
MAGLQHVWVRAKDLQLARADRIIALTVVGVHGRPESADFSYAGSEVGICAEIEGGTEGDSTTRIQLADAAPTEAAEQIGQLAAAITAAAAVSEAHPTECMFVYREGGAARWTSGPELPAWPKGDRSRVSRLGD